MLIGNMKNKNIGIGTEKPYRLSTTYKTQSNLASSLAPQLFRIETGINLMVKTH